MTARTSRTGTISHPLKPGVFCSSWTDPLVHSVWLQANLAHFPWRCSAAYVPRDRYLKTYTIHRNLVQILFQILKTAMGYLSVLLTVASSDWTSRFSRHRCFPLDLDILSCTTLRPWIFQLGVTTVKTQHDVFYIHSRITAERIKRFSQTSPSRRLRFLVELNVPSEANKKRFEIDESFCASIATGHEAKFLSLLRR